MASASTGAGCLVLVLLACRIVHSSALLACQHSRGDCCFCSLDCARRPDPQLSLQHLFQQRPVRQSALFAAAGRSAQSLGCDLANTAGYFGCPDRRRIILARVAHALAHQQRLSVCPLRNLCATGVLWDGASLCFRTWTVLGRGPSDGNHIQPLDGPHQVGRRLHTHAWRNQWSAELVRPGDWKLAVLDVGVTPCRGERLPGKLCPAFCSFSPWPSQE